MQVQSLGREDLLEEGMETHFSILAWRTPWTEEPGRLQSMRLQKVWVWISDTTEATYHAYTCVTGCVTGTNRIL